MPATKHSDHACDGVPFPSARPVAPGSHGARLLRPPGDPDDGKPPTAVPGRRAPATSGGESRP